MGLFLAFGEQCPHGIGSGAAVPPAKRLLVEMFMLGTTGPVKACGVRLVFVTLYSGTKSDIDIRAVCAVIDPHGGGSCTGCW